MYWNLSKSIFRLTITILIFQISTYGAPIHKRDIIAGKDFLSLFIDRAHDESKNDLSSTTQSILTTTRVLSQTATSTLSHIESKLIQNESELPIERMFKSNNKLLNGKLIDENIDSKMNLTTKTDVKVIAVSITSSVKQSKIKKSIDKDLTTVKHQIIDNLDDNKFISNSHKTEFSVDEIDPLLITQNRADSMRSESTNIQSYAAPPSQIKSRTQRKQDALVPYQTVIYHDNGDSNSRTNIESRPVSYSSVSHTIGEIRSWREFDKIQENLNHTNLINTTYPQVYSEPSRIYSEPSKFYSEPAKIYSEPSKIYSEPSKVYGQPEKIYSEPSKVYSQPSKIYSEPSKIYSEPSKIYGEPSKIYSEPSKVYFESTTSTTPIPSTLSTRKIIFNLDRLPYDLLNAPNDVEQPIYHSGTRSHNNQNEIDLKKFDDTSKETEIVLLDDKNEENNRFITTTTPKIPVTSSSFEMFLPTQEQNYEIDESVSVMTNGRQHGVQLNLPTPNPNEDSQKVGYVLEGRNYRKYRVEEKTPDGFIVGEYGIVSHNDGSLRGVRYTADSDTNPKLIYDALLKFLSL